VELRKDEKNGNAFEELENKIVEKKHEEALSDNDEDKLLDVEEKDYNIEDFEMVYSKEEIGCIHELIAPKGYKKSCMFTFFF
jgi:hypothetical protein